MQTHYHLHYQIIKFGQWKSSWKLLIPLDHLLQIRMHVMNNNQNKEQNPKWEQHFHSPQEKNTFAITCVGV
jgi:uncharacterized protein (DUF1919 family)